VELGKYRQLAASLPDALASASPEQVQALLPVLVERVDVRDRQLVGVVFTPPARPYFAAVTGDGGEGRPCAVLARPEGFEPPTLWSEATCSGPLSYGRAKR
jgi:hypothetical protein